LENNKSNLCWSRQSHQGTTLLFEPKLSWFHKHLVWGSQLFIHVGDTLLWSLLTIVLLFASSSSFLLPTSIPLPRHHFVIMWGVQPCFKLPNFWNAARCLKFWSFTIQTFLLQYQRKHCLKK
jgi:hypothetical protein